jgi:hypothetical protein
MFDVWCGDGPLPDNYKKTGSRCECLRIGFGAGNALAKIKNSEDLNNIPYMTKLLKNKLQVGNICNVSDFLSYVNSMRSYRQTKVFIEWMFSECFTNKRYNSVCRFLYRNRLPLRKIPKTK